MHTAYWRCATLCVYMAAGYTECVLLLMVKEGRRTPALSGNNKD